MLRLILDRCADFMGREGVAISRNSIELEKMTLKYPGLADALEVTFESKTAD